MRRRGNCRGDRRLSIRPRSCGEQVQQSCFNFLELRLQTYFGATERGFEAASSHRDARIFMNFRRGIISHLAGKIAPPVGRFPRVNMEIDFRAGVEFFQGYPHDASQGLRIDLQLAMQYFSRDRQRQLDHLCFDAAVVILPFPGELLESLGDLSAMLRDGRFEFRPQLLLRALSSLLEGFGMLLAAPCLGGLAGIRRHITRALRDPGIDIREGRGVRGTLALRSTRRHIPPAIPRSIPVCLPFPNGALRLRSRAGLGSRLWRAPLPTPPCLLSACRRRAMTWI